MGNSVMSYLPEIYHFLKTVIPEVISDTTIAASDRSTLAAQGRQTVGGCGRGRHGGKGAYTSGRLGGRGGYKDGRGPRGVRRDGFVVYCY